MNEAKHTKGPWIVGTMVHDTDIDTQVSCLKENEGTDKEWTAIGVEDADGFSEVIALAHPANASLIAAAPELLEACEASLGAVNAAECLGEKEGIGKDTTKYPERIKLDAIVERVRAAIAKAEGR